jgi:hypothetical protein
MSDKHALGRHRALIVIGGLMASFGTLPPPPIWSPTPLGVLPAWRPSWCGDQHGLGELSLTGD